MFELPEMVTLARQLLERQMLSQGAVDAILAEGRVVMLTDRYAPVDQMLAPVFREEGPK
jgi:hypothetical protein